MADDIGFPNGFRIDRDPAKPWQIGRATVETDDGAVTFPIDREVALMMLEELKAFLGAPEPANDR